MTKLTPSHHRDVISALSRGVIVPTLTPFDENGAIMTHAITDQTRRLAQIDGIVGIAVNASVHERENLTTTERTEVICKIRAGLYSDQLLLCYVGVLAYTVLEEIASCQTTGADAVIGSLVERQKEHEGNSAEERLEALVDLTDRLPLPVIVALHRGAHRRPAITDEIAILARHSGNVIGFDMRANDDVLQYDQDYYALKSIGRPLACLSSSTRALFHNLNTGADGVVSLLAQLAPHEVAALYQGSRNGRFLDAQALHNRLSPLIGLLSSPDPMTRELICREIAHYRGLLASPDMRASPEPLSSQLKRRIHQVVDETGLKPISWV
ncbi:dihydrodipicolinate synthase family protein [Roseovarius dicentrarchi]|uniref:dihydrodipicolinate synthase family protein n=1 Tax=Roseovarius dicentrarchi TaxID=2250573 RepID=UPI00139667FF|nr:dihydrodipicolinate synthase family protein [Roseovarius dicentrarchi]